MEWPDLTPDTDLLEEVRTRAPMYFGMFGPRGNFEALSYLIDEAVGRHLDGIIGSVEVRLHEDQSLSVIETFNPGRVNEAEMTFEEVVKQSRVGEGPRSLYPRTTFEYRRAWVTAVAAKRDLTASGPGFALSQSFEKGHPAQRSRKSESRSATLCTRWLPDAEVMKSESVPVDRLIARLRTLSYLVPGLPITLAQEADEPQRFCSKEGLADYVRTVALDRIPRHEVVRITQVVDDVLVDLAFLHAHCEESLMLSYANHRLTSDGGSHLAGLREGLKAALEEIQPSPSVEPKYAPKGEVGLFAAIAVRLAAPIWVGCTKRKLHNPEIRPLVAELVLEAVRREAKMNPESWSRVAWTAHHGYHSCG